MWMIRAGKGACFIDVFKNKNLIGIEGDVGDLKNESEEDVEKLFNKRYFLGSKMHKSLLLNNLKKFIFNININDYTIVFEPSTRLYYIGIIKSDYHYYRHQSKETYKEYKNQNTILANLRHVKWIKKVKRDDLKPNTKKTLQKSLYVMEVIDKYQEDIFDKSIEIDFKDKNSMPRQNINKTNVLITEYNHTNPDNSRGLENKKNKTTTNNKNNLNETRDRIYREYLQNKSLELITKKINNLNENQIKELVEGLLHAMDYKTTLLSKDSNNEIDIIASPDGLGLKNPVIKVKIRFHKIVVSSDLKNFKKSLNNTDRGLYVSTRGFTHEVKTDVKNYNTPIRLLDSNNLIKTIIEYYDNLDNNVKNLIPLTKIYWPI